VSNVDVVTTVETALREHFGQVPTRAAVSFLGVEPIEVLRFEPIPAEWAYLSLGMSRRPMTAAAESVVSAEGPRAELMLHVKDAGPAYTDVWRRLAVLAASPVVEGVVYTPGMTVDLGQPIANSSRCTGGVVAPSAVASITVGRSGVVDVLQVLPATSTELAWSRVHGTSALRERWWAQGVDLLDLGRRAADLT
jgi:hypothetical protein